MGITSQKQIGDVQIMVTNEGLSEGWDIVSVQVDGQRINYRKGEFVSQADAELAAFNIAEAFKTDKG
ncbi:hypothetical protein PQS90_09085 [Pseudomonas sp. BLCC-B13]|uniref:hypothetical protein n=1 Tax=Pseudomonas sp. BLCC-B13 TaxID=3025314 RepID=UPI00234F0B7A|nr:hypothetical protein [Pseudomonas sp. BLCC-B13]MDC7825303.1 hypothetical protein [Pseudomonas sp. BLCC-B13]